MAFCFSGSLLRANFSIVCLFSCMILLMFVANNFSSFFLSLTEVETIIDQLHSRRQQHIPAVWLRRPCCRRASFLGLFGGNFVRFRFLNIQQFLHLGRQHGRLILRLFLLSPLHNCSGHVFQIIPTEHCCK